MTEHFDSSLARANPVQVAVGVICNSQQQVLVCWRDARLHQGNRHEFPGGKLEALETPFAALQRELREELGIEVEVATRVQQLTYAYPEKTVCLHVFLVTGFQGQPIGQQEQAVQWVDRKALGSYRFPQANAPILTLLELPDNYVIARPALGYPVELLSWQAWVQWHVAHVPQDSWFYVRYPFATAAESQLPASASAGTMLPGPQAMAVECYREIILRLHQARPDLRLMVKAQCVSRLQSQWQIIHGVHFSQLELMQLTAAELAALPGHFYTVAACHDASSIAQANHLKLDAIVLSPVKSTHSHAGQAGLGWEAWQQLARLSHVPVYALGGVAPADLPIARQHGAFGVAGISHFYH